jgi:hypothetical protein
MLTSDVALRADRPDIDVYSPTYASKGLVLNQLVYNTIGEVVLGRQPVSCASRAKTNSHFGKWRTRISDEVVHRRSHSPKYTLAELLKNDEPLD